MNISLISCGSNSVGQLGTSDFEDHHTFSTCIFQGYPSGQVPGRLRSLACGAGHTVVLTERAGADITAPITEVWASGDGRRGQLGDAEMQRQAHSGHSLSGDSLMFRRFDFRGNIAVEDMVDRNGMKPKLIAAAWETTFVVFEATGSDDLVVACGSDDWGCLGTGESGGQPSTSETSHRVDLSPWKSVGQPLRIEDIKAGPSHVIIRLYEDENHKELFIGWGKSRHGQLGSASAKPRSSVSTAYRPHLQPPGIVHATDTPGTKFALGAQHSVFLDSDGRMTGYGSDTKNQLAVTRTIKAMPNDVSCTWNGTYVYERNPQGGSIWASGAGQNGQLGSVQAHGSVPNQVSFPSDVFPQSVVCGTEHVLCRCTRSDHGEQVDEVWGWGWNEHGNLGVGDTKDVWKPKRIWPPDKDTQKNVKIVGLWAGAATSWIALEGIHDA